MSPARVECVYDYELKRSFIVQQHRKSGLPGRINSIETNPEETTLIFGSFEKYGGIPSDSYYRLIGNAQATRTVEQKRRAQGYPLQDFYVLTVALIGEGSQYIWYNPNCFPSDKITVTHLSK